MDIYVDNFHLINPPIDPKGLFQQEKEIHPFYIYWHFLSFSHSMYVILIELVFIGNLPGNI